MRILHINSYYNGCPFYKNIYNYQRNTNEAIVYAHMAKTDKNMIVDNECIIDRPYYKLDRYFYYLKHRKIWKHLTKEIDVSSFDIVHAHSLFSNGYEAYNIFKHYNKEYVVSIRNTDVNVYYKFIFYLRPLALKILLNAKAIIFLSNTYKDYIIDKYIPLQYRKNILSKVRVVPNGIDDYWINNTNHHEKCNNIIRAISVGVIDKNKNHITVCKALKILQKKGKTVSFDVFGRIIDSKELKKLKKYDFFHYHEPIPKESLIEEYRRNDIFVMPSINETFGLVYAEAMSQGLPVIYTRGQGFDGQFQDGEIGYSVDAFDCDGLANLIEQCEKDYNRLSRNCIKATQKYRWNIINNQIMELYKE